MPAAALAEDHERRRAVGPALRQVGAAGVLAHGDQAELANRALQCQHLGAVLDLRPQPLRLVAAIRWASGQGGHPRRGGGGERSTPLPALTRAGLGRHGRTPRGPRGGDARRRPGDRATPRPQAFGGQPGDGVDDVAHRGRPLLGERGHRPVGDAAGDDVLAQVAHVGGDVEGEAVHVRPRAQPDADAAIFRGCGLGVDPHAGVCPEVARPGRRARRGRR